MDILQYFEVSESLTLWLVPLVNIHTVVGLMVIAWMMYNRADSTLRIFGVGLAVFALPFIARVLVLLIHPDDPDGSVVVTVLRIIEGLSTFVALAILLRVAVSDYSDRNRMIGQWLGAIYVLVLFVLWVISGTISDLEWSEAGLLVHDHHPIVIAGVAVGVLFAILEASQIVAEHSRGEPYRTLVLMGFCVFAVCTVISMFTGDGTAWSDSMQVTNDIVLSLTVLVLWITVVKHERAEIAAEHAG